MSDLVGNPEDRFSRVEAHMIFPLSLNMPLFFQNSLRELTVSPNKSVSRRCNYVDADHIKSTNTWGRVSQILR